MRYLLLFLLFAGCAHHHIPGGEYVVEVPAMTVIITDKYLPDGLLGLATKEWENGAWRYRIYIRGNQTDKGINISDYILGHELRHILNGLDINIQDPHEDWEYKLLRGWYK